MCENEKLIAQNSEKGFTEVQALAFLVVSLRGKKGFPIGDFPRRQLWFPRHTALLARFSGPPLAKRPNLGPRLTNTIAKGTIIGDHNPFRCSAGPWQEAKDEIVGAGGSGVSNGEASEVFGVGRSNGWWSVEDQCQAHSPVANSIERPAPHAVPILLRTRQTVEEIIAVDDDRHSG